MTKYKLLDELMSTTYSVDLGLSEAHAEELYFRKLEDLKWKKHLSFEVNAAFSDQNFSWMSFFEEHDIYSAEDENDAKAYAEKIILAPLNSVPSAADRPENDT